MEWLTRPSVYQRMDRDRRSPVALTMMSPGDRPAVLTDTAGGLFESLLLMGSLLLARGRGVVGLGDGRPAAAGGLGPAVLRANRYASPSSSVPFMSRAILFWPWRLRTTTKAR